MNKRQFNARLGASVLVSIMSDAEAVAPAQTGLASPSTTPIKIGLLVYPEMVLLDLIGPLTVFNVLGAQTHLVGQDMAPCRTDVGVFIQPTVPFDEAPRDLDVLFVPGGLSGTIARLDHMPTLAYLAEAGSRASYVTAVCTGSLLLGAAGP